MFQSSVSNANTPLAQSLDELLVQGNALFARASALVDGPDPSTAEVRPPSNELRLCSAGSKTSTAKRPLCGILPAVLASRDALVARGVRGGPVDLGATHVTSEHKMIC